MLYFSVLYLLLKFKNKCLIFSFKFSKIAPQIKLAVCNPEAIRWLWLIDENSKSHRLRKLEEKKDSEIIINTRKIYPNGF